MLEIGDKAILWHIMKMYSHFGFNDFVLCLGHRGDEIRQWVEGLDQQEEKGSGWEVICVDTGPDTNSGGRLKQIESQIEDLVFFVNYADGLANIDLHQLLDFHIDHGRLATLTAVKPRSQFGLLDIGEADEVRWFKEKPLLDQWANGGFFVFNRGVFAYLRDEDVLERDTFSRLVEANQLRAFKFEGTWMCMDTYKDHLQLNELWETGRAFWEPWR